MNKNQKTREELLQEIQELKKENESLIKSNQRYNLLINMANEAIIVIQEGMLRFTNPITPILSGYSIEELLSTNFSLFIHPEDRTMVVNNYQRRINGEVVPGYYIFRLINKNGKTTWVYMSAALIEWEGKPATLNFLTDITESKQTEHVLQQTNKRLEAIISATPDGIGIISLDGHLLFASDKLIEMYDFPVESRDELIGRQSLDFIDPSDHERLLGNIHKLVTGTGDNTIKRYRAIKKDNTRFDVEINYNVLFNSAGEPESILFVERDCTIRKKIEDEAIESRRKIEAIISATPDGIGVISLDGRLQLMSDKLVAMYGYSVEDKDKFIGRLVLDFLDPAEHQKAINKIHRLIGGEVDQSLTEYMAIKKDNSRFYIDINSTLLRDANGKPTGILFVERDITERKRVEAEIKHKNEQLMIANAEKDKFFSIIAHDLRSPFQGLLGLTEVMANQTQDFSDEEIKIYSGSVHNSVENLYKLLENLLEWALFQQHSISFQPKEFCLSDSFLHCVDSIKQRAMQKEISIINNIPPALKVNADERMINSVLRNLLSNAVKFTRKNGTVVATAKEQEGGMIEISVSDTGIGIPDDILNRLFILGEKVGTQGTENELSTGLGLLLCKEFVEKHGGKIKVVSQQGQGSTFYFIIPK